MGDYGRRVVGFRVHAEGVVVRLVVRMVCTRLEVKRGVLEIDYFQVSLDGDGEAVLFKETNEFLSGSFHLGSWGIF